MIFTLKYMNHGRNQLQRTDSGVGLKKRGNTMKGSKVVKARGLPWSATAEEVLSYVPSQEILKSKASEFSCDRWLNSSNQLWLREVKMGFILRSTGSLMSGISALGII